MLQYTALCALRKIIAYEIDKINLNKTHHLNAWAWLCVNLRWTMPH
jgi:hypothetical protein